MRAFRVRTGDEVDGEVGEVGGMARMGGGPSPTGALWGGRWGVQAAKPRPARARPSQRQGLALSMKRTVDLLCKLSRNAFNVGQILDARAGHAAHTAGALQQPRPLLRAHAGDLLEPAAAGAHAGPTCT